jgi:hypothetical protein
MSIPMTASQVLDREFLEIRAKVLELAASFDRLDRAEGIVAGDPRLSLIREAIDVLQSDADDRAEQVQLIFSLHYDDEWQKRFNMATNR